jgi:FAD-dependent urate hydroxylase
MTRPTYDVVVIGAGPYGLAAAAHLRSLPGLLLRVFGEPMSFWRTHMPIGMMLRSPWPASQISDPDRLLTLERFEALQPDRIREPIPLKRFIAYGHWFQKSAVPDVDRRQIRLVERRGTGFTLATDDGEEIEARTVVVAAGIAPFAHRPPVFAELPPTRVSHCSDYNDLSGFAGQNVAVIGGGQSALETAALLREAGASPFVLVRAKRVFMLVRSGLLHRVELVRKLLYAPSDVGPAGVSWLVHAPRLFGGIPRRIQDPLAVRCIRPAGSAWLVSRLEAVRTELGREVAEAREAGGRVRLRLDDGSELEADHVLLGTGYRVDIARYSFLSPELLQAIDRVNGYPRLSPGLESSVAGLHFLGAPAAWSFGPLMRFVAGSRFTGTSLERCISRKVASTTHRARPWPVPQPGWE